MRIKKPSPTRGRRHGGAETDEGAANLIRPLSQPSAASSPERGAFWGASCRSRVPPLQRITQALPAKRCSLANAGCTFYLWQLF